MCYKKLGYNIDVLRQNASLLSQSRLTPLPTCAIARRYGLTGGFLLLRIFSVAISVSPHVCIILDLILISMFIR